MKGYSRLMKDERGVVNALFTREEGLTRATRAPQISQIWVIWGTRALPQGGGLGFAVSLRSYPY